MSELNMSYLNRVIFAAFRTLHPDDQAYLAEKQEDLEALDQWGAMKYLGRLDGRHQGVVADLLGVGLADLQVAVKVHQAVLQGRHWTKVADIIEPEEAR